MSLFDKLFHRYVTFGDETKSFVSVLDTAKRHPNKSDELFCGRIQEIDFDSRTMSVQVTANRVLTNQMRYISFDKIVTISRMNDGRLRMWIDNGED